MKPANNVLETLFQMTNSKKNVGKVFKKKKKTRENTKWALSVWNDWISYREQKVETLIELYTLPKDLSVVPYHELDFWLSKFVVKCRRKDGKPYPPTSLTQIMAAIQNQISLLRKVSIENGTCIREANTIFFMLILKIFSGFLTKGSVCVGGGGGGGRRKVEGKHMLRVGIIPLRVLTQHIL